MALSICWFTFWGGLLYFLGNDKPGSVNSSVLIVTTVLLVLTNCTFLIYSIFIFGREYIRDRRIAQKREKDKKDGLNANAELTQVVPIRTSEEVVEKVDKVEDNKDEVVDNNDNNNNSNGNETHHCIKTLSFQPKHHLGHFGDEHKEA